jgi:Cupin
MSRDTLSDLLRSVRLHGAAFFYVSFRGEWSAGASDAREIAHLVMPGCDHVMEDNMLAKGDGWAAVDGLPPVRLHAGDVVLFPQGDRHVISSTPGLSPGYRDPELLAQRRPLEAAATWSPRSHWRSATSRKRRSRAFKPMVGMPPAAWRKARASVPRAQAAAPLPLSSSRA